jgi:hypothetical protein
MGCCSSTSSEGPLNSNPISEVAGAKAAVAAGKQKGKEERMELAFKSKRAYVFTEGIDLDHNAFVKRTIPKDPTQTKTICKFSNYSFLKAVVLIACSFFL